MNIRNTQRIHRNKAWRAAHLHDDDKLISVQQGFEAWFDRLGDDERQAVARYQDAAYDQLRRAAMDGRLRVWSVDGKPSRFLSREGSTLEDFLEGRTDAFVLARDIVSIARQSGMQRTERGQGLARFGPLMAALRDVLHDLPDARGGQGADRLKLIPASPDPHAPPGALAVHIEDAVSPPDRAPLADVAVTTYGPDGRATTTVPDHQRSATAPIYT